MVTRGSFRLFFRGRFTDDGLVLKSYFFPRPCFLDSQCPRRSARTPHPLAASKAHVRKNIKRWVPLGSLRLAVGGSLPKQVGWEVGWESVGGRYRIPLGTVRGPKGNGKDEYRGHMTSTKATRHALCLAFCLAMAPS